MKDRFDRATDNDECRAVRERLIAAEEAANDLRAELAAVLTFNDRNAVC
jgi:hypothetical protein